MAAIVPPMQLSAMIVQRAFIVQEELKQNALVDNIVPKDLPPPKLALLAPTVKLQRKQIVLKYVLLGHTARHHPLIQL